VTTHGADACADNYSEEDRNMRYIPLVAAVLVVAACSGGGNNAGGNMTDTSGGAVAHPASPGSTGAGVQMDTGMSRDTSMMQDTSTMRDTTGTLNRDTSGTH
jgi:hypothetical protein